MNYPVWQLSAAGGGLLIAVIAIFHVYIAHFAVGGGLFLVLTELKGYRDKDRAILGYVRTHTKFFLLLTMVAGSLSGVGIWFTISVLNPAATSVLIHNFVFAWATEWVFFMVEIISLLVYYYTFDQLNPRNHLIVGWIYFGAAWLSLFMVNGIIDFMLTPGDWLEDNSFWSGFFNPTFWPALFFRSFLAMMIAGLFGFFTSVNIKEQKLRLSMVRYCAAWLLAPFLLLLASAWWYRAALPPEVEELAFQGMPEMKRYFSTFISASAFLLLAGLLMAVRLPQAVSRSMAALMLVLGLLYIGAFEFIREGARRPYIVRDYMYSNSILVEQLQETREQGVLASAKWVSYRHVTDENRLAAGRELFNILCLPCHSVGGPLNDIKKITQTFTPAGLVGFIEGMEHSSPYMPPFAGTPEELRALAFYIAYELNGRRDHEPLPIQAASGVEISPFAEDRDEYVLLAWSDTEMLNISDAASIWVMRPPGTTLRAQLIKRDETPELVTQDVRIVYEVESGFTEPEVRVDFWKYAENVFGAEVEAGKGPTGNGVSGTMTVVDDIFQAEKIPVIPYPEGGGYQPYVAFTLTAFDREGEQLASTRVTVTVAAEMGCRKCHGGGWRVNGRAGMTSETAENILAVHDKRAKTDLLQKVDETGPIFCRRCHVREDMATTDVESAGALNLSAAMHGFHALFMAGSGAETCGNCHPVAETGSTRAFRGIHHEIGLDCVSCHGELPEMAAGLLKAEQERGSKRAGVLLRRLGSMFGEQVMKSKPAMPWVNQPDCLVCHENFQAPEKDALDDAQTRGAGQLYRDRRDESGVLLCAACHGGAHALYPAVNPYHESRDNIQPLQYQNEPYPIGSNMKCWTCHTVEMQYEMHHPNMLRKFRNR